MITSPSVQYSLGFDKDGKRIRKSVYGKTRKEVSIELNKILNKINSSEYIKPSEITVKQWLETWFETYKKDSVAPVTYDSYRDQVRIHIIPHLGYVPLKKLRPEQIQSTFNKMLGYSQRSINYTFTIFNQAMKRAYKNRIIENNPCEFVELPRGTKPQKKKVFSEEEQRNFIDAIRDHQYEMAFIMLLSTGVRIGELLGLSWEEVDFDNNTIYIVKGLSRHEDYLFTDLKTDDSDRIIPILPIISEKLKQHKVEQNKMKLQVGKGFNEHNLVICNTFGLPVNFDVFARSLKLVLENNNLPHLSPHELRHTFATRSLESGVDMKELQELLGHSTMELTSDLYTHVLLKQKRKAIDKTAHLFDNLK